MALTTITKEMVSVNAIQGTLIADNAITAVHIATNAVSGTLVADNAITATHIAQNVITVTQLADDAVEADKIADGVITTNHLNKAMISSQTEVSVATGDFVLIGDTSDSNNLKKAPISSILAGTLTTAAQTNITSLGTLTSLNVDSLTLNGTSLTSSGNLTIDVASDIYLDADGGDIDFRDGGATFGRITNSSLDLVISSVQDNEDILFKGVDGGSAITALTLDMSEAGTASFNNDIKVADDNNYYAGSSNELAIYHTGSGNSIISHSTSASGAMYIDAGGTLNIRNSTGGGENMIVAAGDGAVTLYYDNAAKLATASGGISVTGEINADTILIEGVSNYTGLEVKGSGASRPQVKFTNVNQGVLGQIYGTESNALVIATGTGGATALTIDSSQKATFAGDVQAAGLYVGSTNTSYDFYNNGTSYLNGNVIVDANLTVTPSSGENIVLTRDSGGPYMGVSSNHNLRIITNNAERIRIEAAGDVGIGETSPDARLHAKTDGYPVFKVERDGGSTATQGYTQIGHSALGYTGSSGADSYIISQHGFGFRVNEDNTLLTLTDSDKVGVALTNPFTTFHVNTEGAPDSSGNVTSGLVVSHGVGGNAIKIGVHDTGALNYIQSGYVNNIQVARNFAIFSGASEAFRIDTNGLVGVGTTDFTAMGSSSYKGLKVGGAVIQDSGGGNGSATFIGNNSYVGGSNNYYHDGGGACSGIQMTSGDINFLTFDGGGGSADAQWTPTVRMHIKENGFIAINDNAPTYLLDINASNTASAFRISSGGNGKDVNCSISNGGTSSTDDTLLALSTANGAGDPYIRMSVAGTEDWHIGVDNSDSDNFHIGRNSTVGSGTKMTLGNQIYLKAGGATGQTHTRFNNSQVTVADDGTFDMTGVVNTNCLVAVSARYDGASVKYCGALYWCTYTGEAPRIISDPHDAFANADTDGKNCLYMNGNSNLRFKNRAGVTNYISIAILEFQGN